MSKEEEPQFVIDTKFYIKMLSDLIEKLGEADPKDRMDYALEVTRCLNGIIISVKGWQAWISNIEQLHGLQLKDYKAFYPKMRGAVIDFLKLDLEVTKKKLIEATVFYRKLTKKVKKSKKKKPDSTYVT